MLFIRHAISQFNYEFELFTKENNKIKNRELRHYNHVLEYARRDLIDPKLHENGIKQAAEQQGLLNQFVFRKVYVSPHVRTLMTATQIL